MNNSNQEVRLYVESKHGEWAPSTAHTAYHKLLSIAAIGFSDPAKVFRTLKNQGYKLYSIKSYFTLARSFEEQVRKTFKFREWISANRRQFKNAYKKKLLTLTEEKFFESLAKAPSSDLFNFLILMGKGGLRKSEALSAKWSHLKEGQLEIIGKGGKQRWIPFSKEWLKSSTEGRDLILPRSFVYWKFFKEELFPFTPHDFRSYYATKVVNIPGMSIEDARELLGHENIETTALYLRSNQKKQSALILEHFK